ncbi:hypothetical protein RB195_002976 [Necator americanus]|uniref:CHHC U11-48K-type domain-containing protein n=1 Tax=Necator americanus TaxID=51031 RepID=A0ABR1DLH3_NECAM
MHHIQIVSRIRDLPEIPPSGCPNFRGVWESLRQHRKDCNTMPNSTPMGMDHRHLAIWMWTHSQSLTDNSETSIESATSDGLGRQQDNSEPSIDRLNTAGPLTDCSTPAHPTKYA